MNTATLDATAPPTGLPLPAGNGTASAPRKTEWMEGMLRGLQEDQSVTVTDVTWDRYLALCETRDRERPGVKIHYANGVFHAMSPSYRHEKWTTRLGLLVQMVADEWGVRHEVARATTFRNEELREGLEADECFYFANAGAMADREDIDLERDPPPDVAIEVDMTTDSTAKLGIYGRIGVPEVWRFDGDTIHVRLRQPDGQYAAADRSAAVPEFPLADLVQFLQDVRHLILFDMKREAREWVKTLPKWQP